MLYKILKSWPNIAGIPKQMTKWLTGVSSNNSCVVLSPDIYSHHIKEQAGIISSTPACSPLPTLVYF